MADLYVIARAFNVAASIVVLLGQLVDLRKVWGQLAADSRLRAMAVAAYALATGYGSAESICLGIEPGPRVLFVAAATIVAVASVLVPSPFRMFPRHGDRRGR